MEIAVLESTLCTLQDWYVFKQRGMAANGSKTRSNVANMLVTKDLQFRLIMSPAIMGEGK